MDARGCPDTDPTRPSTDGALSRCARGAHIVGPTSVPANDESDTPSGRVRGEHHVPVGTFFSDKNMMLGDLTPTACESDYEELRKRSIRNKKVFSRDSDRTILAAAKTFLRWCMGKPRSGSRGARRAPAAGADRARWGQIRLLTKPPFKKLKPSCSVELNGIEPSASSMPLRRSPS